MQLTAVLYLNSFGHHGPSVSIITCIFVSGSRIDKVRDLYSAGLNHSEVKISPLRFRKKSMTFFFQYMNVCFLLFMHQYLTPPLLKLQEKAARSREREPCTPRRLSVNLKTISPFMDTCTSVRITQIQFFDAFI